MATKTVNYTSLTNSRTPKSGWMTIGVSSGGTNQNAQATFPALGVTGTIHSVKLYYSWNNSTAGEGFKASATHKATISGNVETYSISGASGSGNVDLTGYSNVASFVVDLRSHTTTSSTSKGYSKNVYIVVNYTPEPTPTTPTTGTLKINTFTADSQTFVWSASTDGIFASNEIMYEFAISLDNGSTWGATFNVAAGTITQAVNFRTYLTLEAAQYYLNTTVKFRVRAKTPLWEGSHYYSDWASFTSLSSSSVFSIDYRITPTAPTLSVDDNEPYEGELITFTCGRPASYNTHDDDGLTNVLNYYVETSTGTALDNDTADVTNATKDVEYTVGNLTSGTSDLSTNARAYCVDTGGQTGTTSANLPITFKRYRAPAVSIGDIDRGELTASVSITIQDTGFATPQANTQIRKIQYKLDAGAWTEATLGSWSGLSNSFTISSLVAKTRYALQVRAVNVEPVAGLGDKTGDAAEATVLEYMPTTFDFKDSVTGVSGMATQALIVHEDDFTVAVDAGCAYVQKDLDVDGVLTVGDGLDVTGDSSIEGRVDVNEGSIWLNVTGADTDVVVNGDAGRTRALRFFTAGEQRWTLGATNDAESGSNAGSNFGVLRYDDDGNYINAPFVIRRNTGNVEINGVTVEKIAHGKVSITPTANSPSYVTIDYSSTGFTATPDIFVTANTSLPGSTVQEVSYGSPTKDGARIYIYRTNTTTTSVSWLAIGV